MKNTKFFVSTLIAAAAMTATAYAEDVTLSNGVKTSVSVTDGVSGAGNTYKYSTPESGTDNGGWIFLGNLGGTANVSLGTADAQASFSGSGIVGIGYRGGNSGVIYNFDLTTVDASAFSGSLMVVNEWNNSTNVKVSGETWKNTTYIFAGASHEIWASSYEGTPPWRMYNDTGRGRDTLTLSGATTFSGIQGTSKGFTVTNGNGVAVSTNAYEFIGAETAGTVLTIAGAKENSFYGTVGSSSVAVGVNMTGTGTQVFGGTNYFDVVSTVSGSTLDLSGSITSIAGAATNAGTLNLSGATVSLSSAISNTGTVTVSSDTTFALASSSANSGVYSIIANSGSGSITGWNDTTLNRSNFTVDGEVLNSRSTIDLSTAGSVTITGGAISLNWVGTDGTGTWNTASTNTPWADSESNAQFFANEDSVTFNTSGASVIVDGTVNPNAMTVSADTTFSGSGEIILAAPGKLTIDNGAKLSLGGDVTLDLGSGSSALGSTSAPLAISGTGTVKYAFTSSGEGGAWSGFHFSDDFKGTMDWTGHFNWPGSWSNGVAINTEALLRFSSHSDSSNEMWGSTAWSLENDVEFGSDYGINLGGSALTFLGDVSAEGNTISVSGANLLTFAGTATIGGLSIASGATVSVSGEMELITKEGSNFSGTLNVLAGGTLTLTGHDALGYSSGGLGSGVISLQGDSTDKANLVINDSNDNNSMTFSKTLNLKGYTEVSSTSVSEQEKRSFNSWGGTINASGIENEISSDIGLRRAFTITVEDEGELLVSGKVKNGQDQDGGLVKAGLGTLILSGENTFNRTLTVSAGTLVAANASALGAGAVTVEKDATLTFATTVSGVAGGVEINEGATFAIDLTGFTQTASEGDEIGFTILTNTALTFNGTGANTLSSGDIESYFDVEGSTLGAYSEWAREWSYENNTLSLTMTIPEPSAFGLLAGVGALALCVSRRRRVKKA